SVPSLRGARCLAWSEGSSKVAIADKDGRIHLWAPDGPKVGTSLSSPFATTPVQTQVLAWSPQGQWLAWGGPDGLRVWDFDEAKLSLEWKGFSHRPFSATWSPDGRRLATACWDGTVHLWDADGKHGLVFRGHTGIVQNAAWSPDGSQIASGGAEPNV